MVRYLFFFLIITNMVMAQSFSEEINNHRSSLIQGYVEEEGGPLDSADVPYLDFYAPDEAYRIKCKVKKLKAGKVLEVPTSAGRIKNYKEYALLKFKLNGKKQWLTVYQSSPIAKHPIYKDYLFLPMKDKTSGNETYGGGRYLNLWIKDLEEKTTVVDFNKLYNPLCAYTTGYNCPIPPKNNTLQVAVEAGEKNFKKEWK